MKTTRLTPKKILDFPCVQMITLQILDNQLVYIIWIRTSFRFPAPYENSPYLTFFELKHSKFYLENATPLD